MLHDKVRVELVAKSKLIWSRDHGIREDGGCRFLSHRGLEIGLADSAGSKRLCHEMSRRQLNRLREIAIQRCWIFVSELDVSRSLVAPPITRRGPVVCLKNVV